MYCVVVFIEDNSVDCCPVNWIIDMNTAYWPNSRSVNRTISHLKNETTPCPIEWKIQKIKRLPNSECGKFD